MRPVPLTLCMFTVLVPLVATSQDLRFTPCPTGHTFGVACRLPAPVLEPLAPPPLPTAIPPQEEPPFTLRTMARDAPEALLTLMQEPTLEHLDAYLDWQARRLARIRLVDTMIKARQQERAQEGR